MVTIDTTTFITIIGIVAVAIFAVFAFLVNKIITYEHRITNLETYYKIVSEAAQKILRGERP